MPTVRPISAPRRSPRREPTIQPANAPSGGSSSASSVKSLPTCCASTSSRMLPPRASVPAVAAGGLGGGPRAARHRDDPGADHFANAVGLEQHHDLVQLVRASRDLDNEGLLAHVDDPAAEDLDDLHDLAAVLRL